MNKPRHPLSAAHAVTCALAILGGPAAGAAIGKSESLVRKASDPDVGFMLDLEQCVALDRACRAATGETPIRDFYVAAVERPAVPPASATALALRILQACAEVGDVQRSYCDAMADGALSPADRAAVATEVGQAIAKLQQLAAELAPMDAESLRVVQGRAS